MAEQEACASAVTEALAAAGEAADGGEGSEARGESLLLPLLQGLLGGGGERLLAGLGAAPADVVADVRRSLSRLRAALAPPTQHPQARALLSLADRLEDALDAADRLDGCRRKPRRRSRANRHTVGVTHEELAEARRLVDRDQLVLDADIDLTPDDSAKDNNESSLERQNDDVTYQNVPPPCQNSTPATHSLGYEPTGRINKDITVVEKRKHATKKPDFYRHSVAETGFSQSMQSQPQPAPQTQIHQPQPLYQPQLIYKPQQIYQSLPAQPQPSPQTQIHQTQPNHKPQQSYQLQPVQPLIQQPAHQPMFQPQPFHQNRIDRRPSDSKSSIAAIANKFDSHVRVDKENVPRRAPVEQPNQKVTKEEVVKRNFYMPLPPTYNFAAPPTTQDDSKPLSRFGNNKRLRMKRANTIDIGRPLGGYKIDSDSDEDGASHRAPLVPDFRPQTDNDRKFVAFMRKTEAAERETGTVQANWSNRFGNIKNAFESREKDDNSRSSSSSSARRFWRNNDESTSTARPRKLFGENATDVVKPPWVTERREANRSFVARQAATQQTPSLQLHIPGPAPSSALILAPAAPSPASAPTMAAQPTFTTAPASAPIVSPPHVPPSPTKPVVVKPFAARPIPVNQFSHAPMSAFKPPPKLMSPTLAPALVWSPPSLSNTASPTAELPPSFPANQKLLATSPPAPTAPWVGSEDKPRKVLGLVAAKFESNKYDPPASYRERPPAYNPPTPPTHAPSQTQNYTVRPIPSQNDLAAPELVRKIDDAKYPGQNYTPQVDAQQLQIAFYEKQIREKNRREQLTNGHREPVDRKPPPPPAYTVTDYTPAGTVSTFVPLQRTPDIEKARAHKVDYLPDVVTNDTDRNRGGISPQAAHAPHEPHSPYSPRMNPVESPQAYQNEVPYTNGTDESVTTEHNSVVTRVMRGPVRGAATITAGVRTRNDDVRRGSAADSLRGALDKFSSPKQDVIAQIERKKREATRSQVRAPVHNGRSPLPAPSHVRPPPVDFNAPPSPGALAASRESVMSSESATSLGSNPLSRSGSWHQVASPKSASPRRVVARAKSMLLLAVPKLYEGGIAREEVTEKKRTVEAFFSGRPQSPRSVAPVMTSARRSLRQTQTSQSYSLGRSRTMPTVSELQFLDESNTDDAFEDLVSALA